MFPTRATAFHMTLSYYYTAVTLHAVITLALGLLKGRPRMITTKHDGKTVIKCTAEGSRAAPQISWQIDEGPEFLGKLAVN